MRIQSVDIARGLCIILVVWGHNAQFNDSVLNHALWTIRMPMMFFVAGSFIHAQQRFGQLARQKADALLKPFVMMALLQAPARMALGQTDVASLAVGVLAGGGTYLPWIYYLWYLPHLWLVFICAHILLSQGQFDRWHPGARMAVVALALCVGIWTSSLASGAPYQIEALPKSLGFFMLGHMSRDMWRVWQDSWPRDILALSTLLTAQYLLQSGSVDASSAEYVIAHIFSAGAGICLVVSVANRLSHWPLFSAALSRCGRESLFILLFHWPLQNLGRHVWPWALPDADPWLTAGLSWLGSVALSLALAQLMRTTYWTAALWLPMPVARKIRSETRPAKPTRTVVVAPAQLPALQPDFADTLPEVNIQIMR